MAAAGAPAPDPGRIAVAQDLYDHAVSEMVRGDHAAACPKLEEVVRIEPAGIGAKATLAACYEGEGRLASAWSTYALVEAAAARAGDIDRRDWAHARAEALQPRLSRLIIRVPEAVRKLPGLTIARDGVKVGAVQWGLALPIDKGRHRLVARAKGKRPWEQIIDIPAEGATISIDVNDLIDAAPPRPPVRTPRAHPSPALPAPPLEGRGIGQRTVGFVTGGLGLAGIAAGSVLGVIALDRKRESDAGGHCDADDRCDTEGLRLRAEGFAAGGASTTAFVAGGVVLAGGIILIATAPRDEGVAVAVAVGPRGVALRGAF